MSPRPELTDDRRDRARAKLRAIVAREGSQTAAARAIGVSPQMVSCALLGRGPGRRFSRLIDAAAGRWSDAADDKASTPDAGDLAALRARTEQAEAKLQAILDAVRELVREVAVWGHDVR